MRLSYDEKADAIYITLLSNKKSTKTEEVREDLLLDFSDGELIGIEILDASKKLSKTKLRRISEDTKINSSQIALHQVKSSKRSQIRSLNIDKYPIRMLEYSL